MRNDWLIGWIGVILLAVVVGLTANGLCQICRDAEKAKIDAGYQQVYQPGYGMLWMKAPCDSCGGK